MRHDGQPGLELGERVHGALALLLELLAPTLALSTVGSALLSRSHDLRAQAGDGVGHDAHQDVGAAAMALEEHSPVPHQELRGDDGQVRVVSCNAFGHQVSVDIGFVHADAQALACNVDDELDPIRVDVIFEARVVEHGLWSHSSP